MRRLGLLTVLVVLVLAGVAQGASSYLHQGEGYVFQTIAARQLQAQGHTGVVKVRPGIRTSAQSIRFTITGHKMFGGVRTDCRWTVIVTKEHTARGTSTSSSGANGVCVEAPGQR